MQVQVSTFASKIPSKYYKTFMRLMKEWDGAPSVGYAFYDIDVLKMKLKEAMEKV